MRTAVITGCTKGIGAAITKKFLDAGCAVVGCYAGDQVNADAFYNNLGDNKKCCNIYKADLSTWDGIDVFIDNVKDSSEFVDYIVINAAITDRSPFSDISREQWDKVMHLNLYAPLFIIQGLDSILNDNGRIIIIGSVMGQYPHAMSLAYAVSKAGVHQMAKNLVKEFADRRITVNVVAPGFVDTPWQNNKDPEQRKRIESKIALRRFAKPEEIAKLCWEVVENPYINGSILNIDGGYDYR